MTLAPHSPEFATITLKHVYVKNHTPGTNSSRWALTMVETLVILTIICVLLALVLPAIQKIRELSRKVHCRNNLRQIALAVHHYESAHRRLPYGTVGPYKPVAGQPYYGWGPDSFGWSWLARLLPFCEEESLYVEGDISRKTLRQSKICHRRIALFLCPSDEAWSAPPRTDAGNLEGFPVGLTNYKGVSGSNWGDDKGEGKSYLLEYRHRGTNQSYDGLNEGDGALFRCDEPFRLRLQAIHDGLSTTFLIGEDRPVKNRWCSWPYANNAYGRCAIPPNVRQPDGRDYDPSLWQYTWSFRSAHTAGLHFAMADGSVRWIGNRITLDLYRSLATIRGGEAVELPD